MSLSSPIRLSHQRPIDKEFEDADDNGVLNLSGRNLRMFPNVPGELCDFADVFEAGKLFTSKLVSYAPSTPGPPTQHLCCLYRSDFLNFHRDKNH